MLFWVALASGIANRTYAEPLWVGLLRSLFFSIRINELPLLFRTENRNSRVGSCGLLRQGSVGISGPRRTRECGQGGRHAHPARLHPRAKWPVPWPSPNRRPPYAAAGIAPLMMTEAVFAASINDFELRCAYRSVTEWLLWPRIFWTS